MINIKKLTQIIFNNNIQAFMIYTPSFYQNLKLINLAWKVRIVLLLIKKATILVKYLGFLDISLKKLNTKLFKYSNINKYTINQEISK